MKPALYLLFLTLFASPLSADQTLGVAFIDVAEENAGRPLQLSLWYPGQGGKEETIGDNAVFVGETAVPDASIAKQKFPLVLVSHGGLRSARDSGAWLSAALARTGYIVLEVNGPRPSTASEAVNEIWHRPSDLSRALDAVLDDPMWSLHIDESRISVVGFALGGTAALMLSGGVLGAQAFIQSCATLGGSPDCGWYSAQNVSLESVDIDALTTSRKDVRVGSVVAVAPEYTHAFSDELSQIGIPTQIVLLRVDQALSGRLLTQAQVIAVPNANVSDGFPVCTLAGPEILSEDGGDPSLCGPSADARRDTHSSIATRISSFLAKPSGS
jgi:predicted dienelactone hydrolase